MLIYNYSCIMKLPFATYWKLYYIIELLARALKIA